MDIIEYDALATSPIVNGEVKITIGENAFTAVALLDAVEVGFSEVNSIKLADCVVIVETDSGQYTFSRMGNWCQPFYDAFCDAYNKAVLRALFVEGNPILTTKGEYQYMENGGTTNGVAPVHIYENSIVVLPPDLKARRVPLCFVSGMDKGDYSLALTLDSGERYTFSKLGYDTAPFAEAAEKQIRKLREKAISAVKELDPSMTAAQTSQIAKLMPKGAAVQIDSLTAIAPSFVSALERGIADTRAADSYKVFTELCNPEQIHIGFKENETAHIEETETPKVDPYLYWLIAPSPDGQHATVEFSEADSATFVYRTGGDFDSFAKQLNRALEAIDFRREVIRLTDEELKKPDNIDYYMASKRTASLQFVRANFVGRIIHSSPESWKKKLLELWSN